MSIKEKLILLFGTAVFMFFFAFWAARFILQFILEDNGAYDGGGAAGIMAVLFTLCHYIPKLFPQSDADKLYAYGPRDR